jgi:D-serine deaminase-like pyridoxal phosphate-dependent protein
MERKIGRWSLVYTRTADCRSRCRSRPRRKRRVADGRCRRQMQTADAEARLRHSNDAKMHRDAVRATSRGREHHHQPVDAQRGLSFFTVQFWLGVCPKRLMADGTRQTPDARRGAEIAPKMRRGEKTAQASRVESSLAVPAGRSVQAGSRWGPRRLTRQRGCQLR